MQPIFTVFHLYSELNDQMKALKTFRHFLKCLLWNFTITNLKKALKHFVIAKRLLKSSNDFLW